VTETTADASSNLASAPRRTPPRWLTVALPIVVLAISAVVIIDAGRGTTFFYDEWIWIMQRRSPGTTSLLEPFNNHLMALPIATYQVLFRVFGLDAHAPYRLVLLGGHLATCGLLYVYLRTRIGWVLALVGAAALAFFGYSWAVIIWPISLGWVYATTAGIGALLLVDRDTRRADAGAAALLLVGIASSGIAVPFVIGLTVELAVQRAWRRIYVSGAALVVFGAWYLGYGSGTSDHGSAGDVIDFAEKLLAQTVGTLLGVDDRGTAAHVVLVVVAIALVALWFALGRPRSPRLIGNAVALASFTALLSYSRATSGLTTWHSYAAAVFVLLTVGELLRDRAPGRLPTSVIGLVVVWSVVWNLAQLSDGSQLQRFRAEEMRAQLAAVDLAGPLVDPAFKPGPLFLETHAGAYLDVAREYGTPAFTPDELRATPAHARASADVALVDGIGLSLVRRAALPGTCVPTPPRRTGEYVVRGRDPALSVAPSDGPATVRLAMFGTRGAFVGRIPSGRTALLRAPALKGGGPWTVRITTDGTASVCTVNADL
jgi:hypothetical protein